MNSGTIANHGVSTTTAASDRISYKSAVAKKILANSLSRISAGRLIIHDGDQQLQFGESQATASLTAHIHIHRPTVYRDIIAHGSIGAGESYMAGDWSSPDLTQVIQVLAKNLPLLQALDNDASRFGKLISHATRIIFRDNSKIGAKKNIMAHYDLSNEFFALFLDPSMMYSAAIFPPSIVDLEEASRFKLQHICARLQLRSSDHLLEIGTGWGAMAIYAARHYGCHVTTTTISKAQFDYATRAVKDANLEHLVTVLEQDYRDLHGSFDKLVSIEMIEAVGHRHFTDYFNKCSSLIKQDGLMLIQAITIPDQRFAQAASSTDFIQKYIFPGGALPSPAVIATHVANDTDMQIVGLEEIGLDYAKTLHAWRLRFNCRLNDIAALGFDDTFIRMWDFYLAYCEGSFLERVIGTSQILLAKPQCQQLPRLSA